MKHTKDTETVYAVAVGRDAAGNLSDIRIGYSEEDATRLVDEFQAVAVLEVKFTVKSSVDGFITERKE